MEKSKVTAFWSVEGGVGKTTLASAYAVHLAKSNPDKVVLLDFNEVFPRVHKAFNAKLVSLNPIYDALEKGELSADVLSSILQKRQGVWIFAGVSLSEFEQFKPEHFIKIISVARQMFPKIVIDVNSGLFFSATYAALKESDEIMMLVEPSTYSLEDAVLARDFIVNSWGVEGKINAVLNKKDNDDIDFEAVERILGMKAIEINYRQDIKDAFIKGDLDKIAKMVFNVKKQKEKTKRGSIFSFLTKGGIASVFNKPL